MINQLKMYSQNAQIESKFKVKVDLLNNRKNSPLRKTNYIYNCILIQFDRVNKDKNGVQQYSD